MEKKFTANQLGAIATLCGGVMWTLTAYGAGQIFGFAEPKVALPMIFVIALIPLYILRIRISYIVGMVFVFLALILTSSYSYLIDAPPWYKFTMPLMDLSFGLVSLNMIVFIYFSFKSYKELGTKAHRKLAYTNNQIFAISTIFAILFFSITYQGLEMEYGVFHSVFLIPIVIGCMLLPFYIRLIKSAFIIGIIISLAIMIGISLTHSVREQAGIFPILGKGSPLSVLSASLYIFSFSLFYLVVVVSMLFSYLTYKELE